MNNVKEGDLYKIINVFGKRFEIRYGYYEERDRQGKYNEPLPIYPDFKKEPLLSADGLKFVTQMQDVCESFLGKNREFGCFGCDHYRHGADFIGLCTATECNENNEQ